MSNYTVSAEFDNSKFERNIKTTIGSLSRFKSSISQMVGSNKTFQELGKTVDSVKVKFSSLQVVAVSTLENIANSAINTGKQLLKSLSVDQLSAGFEQYANIITSTQTILSANAEKGLDAINSQVERLSWFTDETSYNLQSMVNTIGKFTASGRDLETSVTTMIGFSNAAAEAGVNAQVATEALNQAAQTLGKGFFGLNDWREAFSNRGMDTQALRQAFIDAGVAAGTLKQKADGVWQTMSKGKKYTITLDDMDKSLTESKWLTTDVFEQAMASYGKVADDLYDVYNVIVEGKEDFEGNSTFTKEMVDSYIELAEAEGMEIDTTTDLIKIIRKASKATEELEKENEALLKGIDTFEKAQVAKTWEEVVDATKTAASTQWSKVFEIIFGDLEEAKENFTGLANELWDVFAGPISELRDVFKEWKANGGFDLLWSRDEDNLGAVWNIVEALKSYVEVFKTAIEKIFGTVDGDKLISWTEKFRDFTASLILDENGINKWANTIKRIYGAFKNYYGFVKEVVKTISIIFNGSGSSSIHGVINTVAKTVSKVFGVGRTLLSSFNKAFKAVMKEVNGAFKDVFGKGLFDSILSKGGGIVKFVSDTFKSIAKNKELLGNIRTTVVGLLDLFKRAKTTVKRVGEALSEVFGWGKSSEGNAIVKILSKVFEFTAKIFGGVKDSEKLDKFENGFITFVKTAAEVLKSVWGLIKDIFSAGKNLFKNVFGEASEEKSMGKSIGEFLTSTVESIRNFVNELSNNENFINFLKSVVSAGQKVIEFVKELWNTLADGRSVGEVLGDAFGWIGNVFGNLFGSGDAEEAGEMTAKGFAQGIGNGIKWVYNAAGNLVNGIISFFKKLLGIHSPSAVFEDIGDNVIEGFGLPFKDAVNTKDGSSVLGAIKSFIKKIIDFFKDVMKSFGLMSDAADENGSIFSEKLSSKEEWAASIGRTLFYFVDFIKSTLVVGGQLLLNGLEILFTILSAINRIIIKLPGPFKAVIGLLLILGALALVVAKLIKKIMWEIGYMDIYENFSYMLESIGDYFWEMSKKQKAERFKIITEGIIQIAVALNLFVMAIGMLTDIIQGSMDKGSAAVWVAIGIMVVMIGAMIALTIVMNKMNSATSKWNAEGKMFNKNITSTKDENGVSSGVMYLATFLIAFAASIAIMAEAAKVVLEAVSNLDASGNADALKAKLIGGGLLIAAMIAAVLFAIKYISDLAKETKGIKLNQILTIALIMNRVTKVLTKCMIALAAVLVVAKSPEQIASAAASLTLMFAAVMLAIIGMNEYSERISLSQVEKLKPLLVAMTAVISGLGLALSALTIATAISGSAWNLVASAAAIAAILAAVMGALALLGTYNPSQIVAAAGAMAILATSLTAVGLAISSLMLMMALVDPEQLNPHGALWSIVGALTVLTGVMGGLLYLLAKNDKVVAKMTTVGGAFILMGVGALLASSSVLVLALAFSKFIDLMVKAKDVSTATITGFFQNIALALDSALNSILPVLIKNQQLMTKFIITVMVSFADAIRLSSPALEDSVIAVILGMIRIARQTLPQFNLLLVEMLYDLLKTILKHLPKLLEVGIEIGVVAFQALMDLLRRTILILLKTILQFIAEAIPVLFEGLADLIDVIVEQIPILLNRLAAAIYNHATDIIDAAKNVGEALTYAISYGIAQTFNPIGWIGSAFQGIKDAFTGGSKKVEEGGKQLGEAANKGASEALKTGSPSKTMMEIGGYAVEGLVKGINKDQNDVKKASLNMAENLDDTFRNKLGIHSASTVFKGHGQDIDSGLSRGMVSEEALEMIANASTKIGETAVDSAVDAIDKTYDVLLIDLERNSKLSEYEQAQKQAYDEQLKQYQIENGVRSPTTVTGGEQVIRKTASNGSIKKYNRADMEKELYTMLDYLLSDPNLSSYFQKKFNLSDISYLTFEQLSSFFDQAKDLIDNDYRGNNNVTAASFMSQLSKLDRSLNENAMRQKQALNGKALSNFDPSTMDDGKKPLERIIDLTKTTFGEIKDLFSELGDSLGIKEAFGSILGVSEGGSFLDGLTSKLGLGEGGIGGAISGALDGLSFNFDTSSLTFDIPTYDSETLPGIDYGSYADAFNTTGSGSYDISSYGAVGAETATSSAKGSWSKVSSNNSNQTNNFYITSDDPDAVASSVSRTLQRQAERRSSEWH